MKKVFKYIIVTCLGIIALGAIIFGISACSYYYNYNDTIHTNVMITEKYRVNNGDHGNYWIVLCESPTEGDLEFKIEDNMLRGQFNSTTIFNKIKIGKKYDLTTVGFRSGFLSEYPNIINYVEVENVKD